MQRDQPQTFATSRTRPLIVAVTTTLLAIWLEPWKVDFGKHLGGQIVIFVLVALCLYGAVRSWRVVLHGRSELRMTPVDLTVTHRGRQLTIPWYDVADIRIGGRPKRPWVVARLTPTVNPADVPVSRGRDGAYKLFPVAHGQSAKRRTATREQLRTAILAHGRRYLDPV